MRAPFVNGLQFASAQIQNRSGLLWTDKQQLKFQRTSGAEQS